MVIYELWTGPAAGAGGPPIKVSRRKLPAWDGRVTAFTEQPQLRARLSAETDGVLEKARYFIHTSSGKQ